MHPDATYLSVWLNDGSTLAVRYGVDVVGELVKGMKDDSNAILELVLVNDGVVIIRASAIYGFATSTPEIRAAKLTFDHEIGKEEEAWHRDNPNFD